MIKALLLVFDSARTWESIELKKRSWWWVLLFHLLPLLAFTGLAEAYALINWGKYITEVGRNVPKTPLITWYYVALQFGGSLVLVFAVAWIVKVFNKSIHGIATYGDCFSLVAYGLSPLFTVRLLDVVPGVTGIYSWASLVIGGCLVLATLYSGMPRLLRLTPGGAFGQYLSSVVITLLLLGVLRKCALIVLEGNMSF